MFDVFKKFFVHQKNKDLETQRVIETSKNTEIEKQDNVFENYILCDGEKYSIDAKVVHKELPTNCYSKSFKFRDPKMIVTHWDVTLSADKCYSVLKKLKISTHFCIDNDGTIFQFVDTNHVAWHAGPTNTDRKLWKNKKLPSWNKMSIGIDFSNAYYERHQKDYERAGFRKRPVLMSTINGMRLGPHLGFYPEQIEAYKKLVTVLTDVYKIPLECPIPLNYVNEDAALGNFAGILNHYNLTKNKIDCAGLPLDKIVKEIREKKRSEGKS